MVKIPAMLGAAGRAVAGALDLTKLDPRKLKADRDRAVGRAGDSMPTITRVIPVPRAIPLGGSPRVATELQLGDLAELQAWLEEREPHPLAGLPPAWADPDPGTRRARLAAAWRASASWPARLGTERAAALLAEPGGRCYLLALVLRKADQGFGPAQAVELLPRVTPAEWAMLWRVAWAITPREEIAGELAPDPSPSRASNWSLSAYRAVQAGVGVGYGDLAGLYLSQWRNLCAEGKAAELGPEFGATARRVDQVLRGTHEPAIHEQADL